MSSIDLTGLSSYYSDIMATQAQTAQAQKLQQTVGSDYKNATSEELLEACKEFEAYFLEQMFKEMANTIPENDNEDATTQRLVDYFKDNAIQQIAKDSTETKSLGLAQMLYEQMKRNYGIE